MGVLDSLAQVFTDIWFVVTNIPGFILYSVITSVNAIIVALAAFVQALLNGIGITMPSPPTLPASFTDIESWVAWFIPISTIVDIIVFYAAAWLMWFLVSIGLRWARAVGE